MPVIRLPRAATLAAALVLTLVPATLAGASAHAGPNAAPQSAPSADTGPAFSVPSRGGVRLGPMNDDPNAPLARRLIVVDPGHNRYTAASHGLRGFCTTSGTASRAGAREHALNWDLGQRLGEILRRRGATIIVTRPSDHGVGPCVDERADIGNRTMAELVISLHADGNNNPRARGFHVITSPSMASGSGTRAASLHVAKLVRERVAATGMPVATYIGSGDAMSRRSDLTMLNRSTRPIVLFEAGNMRHPTDAAMLADGGYRQRLAQALADATVDAFPRR